MRTFIKDNINLAGYKLLPILEKIGKNIGIKKGDIVWLTYDEIINITKLDILKIKNLIAKRKKGFSAGTINNVLVFDDFSKYNSDNQFQEALEDKNIKGSTAFRGGSKRNSQGGYVSKRSG